MASIKAGESYNSTEIPLIVENPLMKKKYQRGKFLGKGGFAKCYELIDVETRQIYAGKIVAKSQLVKPHHKEKMSLEIAIHRSISHKNIIKFHGFFEDNHYIYIILELCSRRSLMEMHRRRRTLTEPEVRYFVRQIVQACSYLHENKIIHRDLKLGNLLLNSDMELKVGDFGLATRLDFHGERKKTLCGTPNYIAPEVLSKKGHSFEVDVWSLGCIVYTLIVGRPPFETSTLKDTYARIKRSEYRIPSRVTAESREFIQKLLRMDPTQRPSMPEILKDPYLTKSYIPSRIPVSCLSTEPRLENRLSLCSFSAMKISPRRPLKDVNKAQENATSAKPNPIPEEPQALQTVETPAVAMKPEEKNPVSIDLEKYLLQLLHQLNAVVNSKPSEKEVIQEGEAEDPAAIPIFWISKWVDYSDKYGLGYQLCDNSVGVLFNDNTRIVLLTDGTNFQYIEKNGAEQYHSMDNYPTAIKKKVTLLNYFRTYMNEHLLKTGEAVAPREGDELTRLPYLFSWFRSRNAIVLYLTNGTVQINFFEDHTKIILCPLMGAVTYIDKKSEFRTFRLKLLEKHGCSRDLDIRLKYAKGIVQKLLTYKATTGKVKTLT